MAIVRFLTYLLSFRRWHVARIKRQYNEQWLDWIFRQPTIAEIDRRIMQVEAERGALIMAQKAAPADYPWDYQNSPYPEPAPAWKYNQPIREKTREWKHLMRQSNIESYRLTARLSHPPKFV